MKRRNVLLLVNQLHTGGAQKVVANLSLNLSDNYNVFLVIYNDTDRVVFDYSGELIKLSLPFAKNTHLNSFYKRAVRFWSLIRQLRKIKQKHSIDVSISFMEASNIANLFSKRKERLILSVRSYLSHEFADHPRLRIFKSFIKRWYNKADYTIVPSQLLKQDLVDNFGVPESKISIIYNFTDFQLVQKLSGENIPQHHEAIFKTGTVLINVGRLTNPKAQWLLIPVIAKLKKEFNIKLMILGEGTLKEKIIETAHKAGLRIYIEGESDVASINDNDIFLIGFIKNPFPYLQRSKIFIKSSIYEGFPNVIIEAMTCALPIISSDCESGPREILSPFSDISRITNKLEEGEYGILVPPGEKYPDAASEAVKALLTDPAKMNHYTIMSQKRSLDFGKKEIIANWMRIIDEQ